MWSRYKLSVCPQLWEQTQAENTKLRLELSGVKNENETLKHQLGSAAQQVSQINAVTDAEKREKQIVLKKLAEMEEELKVRLRTINSVGAKTIKFQSLPVTRLNRFGNFYTKQINCWWPGPGRQMVENNNFTFQLLALSENLTDQVREEAEREEYSNKNISFPDPGPAEGRQRQTEAGERGSDQSHDWQTQVREENL